MANTKIGYVKEKNENLNVYYETLLWNPLHIRFVDNTQIVEEFFGHVKSTNRKMHSNLALFYKLTN